VNCIPGAPQRREYLLQATRIHEDVFDRSIDTRILWFRRKLETDPSAPQINQTERALDMPSRCQLHDVSGYN